MEKAEVAELVQAGEDEAGASSEREERVRICMSCCRRPATRIVLNVRGRRQYRCEVCYARKNVSGFKAQRK